MNKEEFKSFLLNRVIPTKVGKNLDWEKREVDIFFSDGYDSYENRTIFFCVKGSPNRFYGYAYKNHDQYVFKTNLKNFKMGAPCV